MKQITYLGFDSFLCHFQEKYAVVYTWTGNRYDITDACYLPAVHPPLPKCPFVIRIEEAYMNNFADQHAKESFDAWIHGMKTVKIPTQDELRGK